MLRVVFKVPLLLFALAACQTKKPESTTKKLSLGPDLNFEFLSSVRGSPYSPFLPLTPLGLWLVSAQRCRHVCVFRHSRKTSTNLRDVAGLLTPWS